MSGAANRRLREFDYRTPGVYFVTICAYKREMLFENTDVQDLIVRSWRSIPNHFPEVETDSFVVMPNHVHRVIMIKQRGSVGELSSAHLRTEPPSLLTIVQNFKAAVAREARSGGLLPLDALVWQRSFYDRVIRDEAELDRIRLYIANNPAAWAFDRENPAVEHDAAYLADWGWLEGPETGMVSGIAR